MSRSVATPGRLASALTGSGALLRWLLAAALVGVAPQGALAQDGSANEACLVALRALEDSAGRTELDANSGLVTHVALSTDARTSFRHGGSYLQREERTYKGGRVIAFRNSFVCYEGAMALEARDSEDANEPSESFDPPLTYLPLPVGGRKSWTYSGLYTIEIFGEEAKLPARGSGTMDPPTTIDTAAGPIEAVHVHWELRVGRKEMRDISADLWFRTQPTIELVKRRTSDSDSGESDVSLDGSGAVDSGSGQKIIIILDPSAPGNELK